MNEKNQSFHERIAGSGGLGDIFSNDDDGELVRVSSGVHDDPLPVAHMTVGEVRTRFRDRFEIDPRSQAVLDGHHVNDDVRVQPGQTLAFVPPGGEKGLMRTEQTWPTAGASTDHV